MIKPEYLNALRTLLDRLGDDRVIWAVTGSLGMALQGVGVPVRDIDVQADERGAYEIERRFADCVLEPVRESVSERIRSHLGRLKVGGIDVEIMGDVRKRGDAQTWEEPIDLARHRQWVEVDALRVPVLSLEYEYTAYLKLGRTEKADLLRRWLERARAD